MSPHHELADKERIKEADLERNELLMTSHNCSFRHMLLTDLEQAGVSTDIILETSSKEILKQFAANGLGVAFMPDMVAEEEVKKNKLVKLKWAGADFPVYSQVFVHKDKHINRAIAELVAMIG